MKNGCYVITFLCVVFIGSTGVFSASSKSTTPVSTQDQLSAAKHFYETKAIRDSDFSNCMSSLPDTGDLFRYMKYIWDGEALAFAIASDKIMNSADSSRRKELGTAKESANKMANARFRERTAAEKTAYCNQLAQSLNDLSFVSTSVEDAKILSRTVATDDAVRIRQRNIDMTIGCIKRMLNTNGVGQYDRSIPYCECQTRTIVTNASDTEIDNWLDLFADKEASKSPEAVARIMSAPWVARVMAAAEQCENVSR